MKNQFNLLPDAIITMKGNLSSKCVAAGLTTFKAACQHIQNLPYGELLNTASWENTLSEKIGDSSTKHAFIKSLAGELGISCSLKLCVYSMTEQNTPGVGVILDRYRMQSIPEAHCYLQYENTIFDFTRHFYDTDYIEPISSFIYEELVEAEDAPIRKKNIHRKVITERFGAERLDHIWNIRNKCIAALEH